MAETVQLNKTTYSNNIYSVVDSTFNQLIAENPVNNATGSYVPTVDEFFQTYNLLFNSIPASGSNNSHLGIVTRSAVPAGIDLDVLYTEIQSLRAQNVSLQQQILVLSNSNTSLQNIPTIS